ncbi:hypothetical protein HN695_03300 [Candidatus Woesearchaeota archaeon]|nr:hypothetical protein [Candidatus Woesearchaeota archaeon]MBT5272011.1 hypothetical protein [Candidatus Woesearchaeota archaeon]MBT6040752.1 hypothetical protein [Candidatus Woesearchaeota archaeon]MBT6336704.1 hypothetical protein [Candidatus Woesearchaeota archaeon]MBT7927337.1 hypothetical protein [Candidatus Woesearchaeota archaeon]
MMKKLWLKLGIVLILLVSLVPMAFAYAESGECTDSDGNWNLDVKGTIIGTHINGYEVENTDYCTYDGQTDMMTNACSGENCRIKEWACSENGIVGSNVLSCQHGCSDGACLPAGSAITTEPAQMPAPVTAPTPVVAPMPEEDYAVSEPIPHAPETAYSCNDVLVEGCQGVPEGVKIRNYGEEYVLTNGCRHDPQHGWQDYYLECVGNEKYNVCYKPCGGNDATTAPMPNQPMPVNKPMPVDYKPMPDQPMPAQPMPAYDNSLCRESDGGQDLFNRGTVWDGNMRYADFCSSPSQVVEFFCNREGVDVMNKDPRSGGLSSSGTFCPRDTMCRDGACVKKTDDYRRTTDGRTRDDVVTSAVYSQELTCGGYIKIKKETNSHFVLNGDKFQIYVYPDTNEDGVFGYRAYLRSLAYDQKGDTSGIMGVHGKFNDPEDKIKVIVSKITEDFVEFKVMCLKGDNAGYEILPDEIVEDFDGVLEPGQCKDMDGNSRTTKAWSHGFNIWNDGQLSWGDYCTETEWGSQTDTGAFQHESICLETSEGYYEVRYADPVKCANGCSNGVCLGDGEYQEKIKEEFAEDVWFNEQYIPEERGMERGEDRGRFIERPEFFENLPRTQYKCDGCFVDDRCLPLGTRKVDDRRPVYCGMEGNFDVQKKEGNVCDNNFECGSNFCSNGECMDIGKELKETKNILNKLMKWFSNWF